jgi:aminoglycoside phosphotransferase (APT) family kinase protein
MPRIILMDLVPGRALSVWNSSIPINSRHTFLDALAQFLLELWSTNATGRTNASDNNLFHSRWLENLVDKAIARCITSSGRWGIASDYLVMRFLIPHYTLGVGEFTKLKIAHGDLNAHNFMVDEEFELTGFDRNSPFLLSCR